MVPGARGDPQAAIVRPLGAKAAARTMVARRGGEMRRAVPSAEPSASLLEVAGARSPEARGENSSERHAPSAQSSQAMHR